MIEKVLGDDGEREELLKKIRSVQRGKRMGGEAGRREEKVREEGLM